MSIFDQIKQDYKKAFKEKDKIAKEILNFILAQIKNKQIELWKQPDDTQIIKIIQKEIKTRKEAIENLKKVGNQQEVEIEEQKIKILEKYLPKMFSKEQLQDIVQKEIRNLNITDLKKQRGILIKNIMEKYGPQVDWKLLNQIINTLLSS